MVTIKDIARQANVSTATVSYVLNGLEHKVSADTRKRIQRIIKETGYRPNLLARGLKQTQTKMIGVMLVDVINPFFAEIISGIHDACREADYHFILTYSEDDPAAELESLYTLIEHQVDGIIITPVVIHENDENRDQIRRDRERCVAELAARDIPIVSMINKLTPSGCHSITHDVHGGASQAVRHLIELGHRRIALMRAVPLPAEPDPRYRAFCETLAAHDVVPDPELMIPCTLGIDTAYEAVKSFVARGREFTAVFAFNDQMAIGAHRALHEAGLSVPDDVALVGFDNIRESAYLDVALSTVNLPKYELGSMAVDQLLRLIRNGPRTTPSNVVLETQLVVRESSAGARRP